ncbi:MAG: NAD(P)-binding domain-containing protein [Labilithrix sp.]
MSRTVAIIGGGPSGLAAACACLRRKLVPVVLEAETPGASLARFGPTRFYTPLKMNLPVDVIAFAGGTDDLDTILTGPEIARILEAAAASPTLAPYVQTHHRVTSITRGTLSRGEMAGHPVRAEMPFRVVANDRVFEVDAVLDASGTYGNPVPLAIPCSMAETIRDLGVVHARRRELASRRILLTGHGHSAATALLALETLTKEAPDTLVTWVTRSRNRRPVVMVPSDPLPERERIVAAANALAESPPPWLRVERAAPIESLIDGVARLPGGRTVEFDVVVALIGYRPNLDFLSELPLEISPATEGAARLSRALANVTDCLSVPSVSPGDLASGEPRFHMIGAKSYGRSSSFLLQTGYAQIDTILDHLFD